MDKYQGWSLEELGSFASDYHKDVFGFRPRGAGLYSDRGALIRLIEDTEAYMEKRKSTFAGREGMRAEGWMILETDPELIQRSIWLAQERDATHRTLAEEATERGERVFWTESMAEEPIFRRAYGMEIVEEPQETT